MLTYEEREELEKSKIGEKLNKKLVVITRCRCPHYLKPNPTIKGRDRPTCNLQMEEAKDFYLHAQVDSDLFLKGEHFVCAVGQYCPLTYG